MRYRSQCRSRCRTKSCCTWNGTAYCINDSPARLLIRTTGEEEEKRTPRLYRTNSSVLRGPTKSRNTVVIMVTRATERSHLFRGRSDATVKVASSEIFSGSQPCQRDPNPTARKLLVHLPYDKSNFSTSPKSELHKNVHLIALDIILIFCTPKLRKSPGSPANDYTKTHKTAPGFHRSHTELQLTKIQPKKCPRTVLPSTNSCAQTPMVASMASRPLFNS